MVELLIGAGLAASAGLNAYIPLLVLGLADRTGWLSLPEGWGWLGEGWALTLISVLLVIEVVADKIPIVDSIHDGLQTVIRPASGGLVFTGGAAAQTVAEPSGIFAEQNWVPVISGVILALVVHLAKASLRLLANLATVGIAAPLLSTVEEASSIALAMLALIAPALILVALAGMVTGFVFLFREKIRARRV